VKNGKDKKYGRQKLAGEGKAMKLERKIIELC